MGKLGEHRVIGTLDSETFDWINKMAIQHGLKRTVFLGQLLKNIMEFKKSEDEFLAQLKPN